MADDPSQSQPSASQGPSWSKLGGLMQVADPQLLINLGLGIASAAKYGGNLGDGLMGAMNNYTNQKAAQQQYQINALNLQRQRAIMAMIPGLMGGQGATPAAAPGAPTPPAGGLLQTGTPSPALGASPPAAAPESPQAPSYLSPPSASDIGGLSVGGMDPRILPAFNLLSGKDPLAGDAEIRAAQLQRAAQINAPQIARLASVVNSDNPMRDVKADQTLQATWAHYATARGLDPEKDFNNDNVRQVMGGVANAYRQQLGQPESAVPLPLENRPTQYGGVGQFDPRTGKKEGDLLPPMPPTFALEDRWNPVTQKMEKVPVQTGGFGMAGTNPRGGITTISGPAPAPLRPNAPRASGSAPAQPPAYDVGFKPPTDQELKSAMFAGEMRAGMKTMGQMEQKGFQLSPSARTVAINMATEEDPGAIKQLISQEVAAHRLTADEQTYLSAMMPMLQAAGHDQSGARLTTAQIRQNVESLLPLGAGNKANLEQVQKNRDGFYTGLLTQAGPAVQLPQYRDTLLSDLNQRQGKGSNAQHPANIQALLKKYARASAAAR